MSSHIMGIITKHKFTPYLSMTSVNQKLIVLQHLEMEKSPREKEKLRKELTKKTITLNCQIESNGFSTMKNKLTCSTNMMKTTQRDGPVNK